MSTHLYAFDLGTDAVRVYHKAPEGGVSFGLRKGAKGAAFVAVDSHRADSRVPLDGEEFACYNLGVRVQRLSAREGSLSARLGAQ